jgi:hypothetical protein
VLSLTTPHRSRAIRAVLARVRATWRRDARAFTLIEVLIAASLGIAMTTIAFSALRFVQINVTRTDTQTAIDQSARTALTNLMVELHSGCIAPKAKPIREGSKETMIKYINARNEAARTESATGEEAHVKPWLHEVFYESTKEELIEKKWEGLTENSTTGEWTFSATAKERILAEHVQQTWENSEHKAKLPVFRYYKYYEPGESGYEAGYLNPSTLTVPLSLTNSEKVAKVTVAFSVAPDAVSERKYYKSKAIEPIALEDSAVYRLTPASTAESPAPQPCA